MPITDQSERVILGRGLFALGCSLGGLAAVLGIVFIVVYIAFLMSYGYAY